MAARIDLNHKVHVLTKKEELDTVRLTGKVVVVLDILFATTTMVTALAHGAKEVVPVLDESAAWAIAGSEVADLEAPQVDTEVWIEYEYGDPAYPRWVGLA